MWKQFHMYWEATGKALELKKYLKGALYRATLKGDPQTNVRGVEELDSMFDLGKRRKESKWPPFIGFTTWNIPKILYGKMNESVGGYSLHTFLTQEVNPDERR